MLKKKSTGVMVMQLSLQRLLSKSLGWRSASEKREGRLNRLL
jgi:hypothetical protein